MIETYTQYLSELGKSKATVSAYVSDAKKFLKYCRENKIALEDLSLEVVAEYRKNFLEGAGDRSNSVRRSLLAIRQFIRFLGREKAIPSSEFIELLTIPDRDENITQVVDEKIFSQLRENARKQVSALKALRDELLLLLLGYEALKATEAIHVTRRDILKLDSRMLIHIGGPRGRAVQLSEETTRLLNRYLEHTESAAVNNLLVSFRGPASENLHLDESLSRHGLKFALYELGTTVGLPRLNSEELRHFAIERKLDQGVEPAQIMKDLGLRRLGNVRKIAILVEKAKSLNNEVIGNSLK